jgi:hypothetical protein
VAALKKKLKMAANKARKETFRAREVALLCLRRLLVTKSLAAPVRDRLTRVFVLRQMMEGDPNVRRVLEMPEAKLTEAVNTMLSLCRCDDGSVEDDDDDDDYEEAAFSSKAGQALAWQEHGASSGAGLSVLLS